MEYPPPHGETALVGQGPLIIQASPTHSDTSQSLGLLWTSDQPVAATSTSDHTALSTDTHPCPRRDLNPQSQEASGRRPTALDRAATGTGVNGEGPIDLAYHRYNFLFYGTSPTSKPKAIAMQIYPER